VAGILGLVQTIANHTEASCIEIFGPVETRERFNSLMNSIYFKSDNISFKITELDVDKLTTFYENEDYYLQAAPLDHNIPCLGFNFVEKDRLKIAVSKTTKIGIPEGPLLGKLQKGEDIEFKGKKYSSKDLTYVVPGKKVSVIMDTGYTKGILDLAQNADLLISEATYLEKHVEKGEQNKHLTVKQAALIASNVNAKKLVMIHFSQRYKHNKEIEDEAKDFFAESYAGHDFMKIKL
jgi:ribonuclease Z